MYTIAEIHHQFKIFIRSQRNYLFSRARYSRFQT